MPRGRKKKEVIISGGKLPETVKEEMVAMTREAAEKQLLARGGFVQWSELQKKLYTVILSKIKWDRENNSSLIELNAEDVVKSLNWDIEKKSMRVAAHQIVTAVQDMVETSNIALENPYTGEWFRGHLITKAYGKGCIIHVQLEPQLMPHFENMYEYSKRTGKGFLTEMSGDLYSFSSGFTAPLYMELALKSKNKNIIETCDITLNRIRELCHLDDDAYMRINPKTGERSFFDKANFNKRVITKFIEDINNSEMMEIFPNDNGKYFEEIKAGGSIFAYRFRYMVRGQFEMEKNRAKALLESKEIPKTKENLKIFKEMKEKAQTETYKNKVPYSKNDEG